MRHVLRHGCAATRLRAPAGHGHVPDLEVSILRLSPGAKVIPHTGSSNARLNVHFGLRVRGWSANCLISEQCSCWFRLQHLHNHGPHSVHVTACVGLTSVLFSPPCVTHVLSLRQSLAHVSRTPCVMRRSRVPTGSGIKVGDQTRTWKVGEALVFDDSFDHEVQCARGRHDTAS